MSEGPTYTVENLTRGITLATQVRIAGTSAERRQGLLATTTMQPGDGLWLVGKRRVYSVEEVARLIKSRADNTPLEVEALRARDPLQLVPGAIFMSFSLEVWWCRNSKARYSGKIDILRSGK